MKILHALEEITDGEPRVFVLGFFDGCHLGHQAVFKEAAKLAEEKSAGIGVITFYPHPMSVLAPGIRVPLLQSEEEKAESFRKAGMDLAVFIRPTKEFLSETAESFLKNLADIPGIKGIVTGDNFSFGKGASGNVSSMKSYFEGSDVAVVTAPLVSEGGKVLSSTTVRTLIEAGKVEEAAKLLGRNYTMSGDVVHGFHRGNDLLGFPTANLRMPDARVLPADGVYATKTRIEGKCYPSVTNIGTNPTFGNSEKTIETFIIDFDEEIYGKSFTLEWVKYIRGEVKFDSVDALKAQIESDIEAAKKILF